MTTIVSWNVNGIRAAIRNGFLAWLETVQPDVLCLQETRVMPGELEPALLAPHGYQTFWRPAQKRGYSGVATFTKTAPKSESPMGDERFDSEGRVQIVEFESFTLVNAYFPNSQPERARIDYKLEFCEAITALCKKLRRGGRHVALCGDFNIAHTEIDLARPKENEENPGYLPEEREAMTQFLKAGHVDTFRHFTKDPGHYTWWSYRGGARERNVGWRLDYHCVSKDFMPHVKQSIILPDVTGSDHCPVSMTIA